MTQKKGFVIKLDGEDRFVMPAEIRKNLDTEFVLMRSIDKDEPDAIWLMNATEVTVLMDNLERLVPKSDAAGQRLISSLPSSIYPENTDRSWRVRIPGELLKMAKIKGKDIVICEVEDQHGRRISIRRQKKGADGH